MSSALKHYQPHYALLYARIVFFFLRLFRINFHNGCRSVLTDTTFIQCEIYNQFWYAHRYFCCFILLRVFFAFLLFIYSSAQYRRRHCSNRLCLRVNYTIHVINLILSFLCVSILLQTDVSNGTCLIFGSTASDSACRPICCFAGHCVSGLSPIPICIPQIFVAGGRKGWPTSACTTLRTSGQSN